VRCDRASRNGRPPSGHAQHVGLYADAGVAGRGARAFQSWGARRRPRLDAQAPRDGPGQWPNVTAPHYESVMKTYGCTSDCLQGEGCRGRGAQVQRPRPTMDQGQSTPDVETSASPALLGPTPVRCLLRDTRDRTTMADPHDRSAVAHAGQMTRARRAGLGAHSGARGPRRGPGR